MRLLALLLLLSYADARATAQSTATRVNQYMRALVKLHQFSGTVLVAKHGKPLVNHGYGMANLEWQIPNRSGTKFRIGSVTKQFTSMAIMILQERGKLKVQDTICQYVRDCPARWQPITIHQLLTHTSGIPDFTDFPDYERIQAFPISPQALVDSLKSKPLDFQPGEKFQYSNSGYAVLGVIIERAASTPYATFVQRNIFDPLGMKNTGYDSNLNIIPGRAAGYTRKGGVLLNSGYIDMSVPYSAGGLYSTVDDLLRWDQALATEKLVTRKSLTAMFTPYIATIGYGWAIEKQFNHKMISHEGGIQGFVSKIARYPDDHVTIIALSNLDTAPITNISRDLAAIVFGEKYETPRERKFIHLDAAKLVGYAGKYQVESAPDILITITVQADKLVSQVQGQSFVLLPESDLKFSSEDASAQVVFARDASGQVTSLIFNGQFNSRKLSTVP